MIRFCTLTGKVSAACGSRHSWSLVLACLACLSGPISGVRGEDLMPLFQPVSTDSVPKPAAPPVTAPEPAPFTQSPKTQIAPVPQTPPAAFDPAGDLQRQKDERFRELKRQLEILNQLSEPNTAAEKGNVPFSRGAAATDAQQRAEPDDSDSDPDSSPDVPVPPIEQRLHDRREVVKPLRPSHEPEAVVPAPTSTVTPLIVEGTIDRFALATSLFGTGQTEVCLDVLKHTDLTQLNREDQVWAEYMQACCHRKAGRIDLAQQSYRRILAAKDADWIGQLARWWLDELDAKSRLQADIARLKETLNAWEAEIDTLSKQSAARTTAVE